MSGFSHSYMAHTQPNCLVALEWHCFTRSMYIIIVIIFVSIWFFLRTLLLLCCIFSFTLSKWRSFGHIIHTIFFLLVRLDDWYLKTVNNKNEWKSCAWVHLPSFFVCFFLAVSVSASLSECFLVYSISARCNYGMASGYSSEYIIHWLSRTHRVFVFRFVFGFWSNIPRVPHLLFVLLFNSIEYYSFFGFA